MTNRWRNSRTEKLIVGTSRSVSQLLAQWQTHSTSPSASTHSDKYASYIITTVRIWMLTPTSTTYCLPATSRNGNTTQTTQNVCELGNAPTQKTLPATLLGKVSDKFATSPRIGTQNLGCAASLRVAHQWNQERCSVISVSPSVTNGLQIGTRRSIQIQRVTETRIWMAGFIANDVRTQ